MAKFRGRNIKVGDYYQSVIPNVSQKYITSHWMLSYEGQVADKVAYAQKLKDGLYGFSWLYSDVFDATYVMYMDKCYLCKVSNDVEPAGAMGGMLPPSGTTEHNAVWYYMGGYIVPDTQQWIPYLALNTNNNQMEPQRGYYNGSYGASLIQMMDAFAIVGHKGSPGQIGGAAGQLEINMMRAVWNHPALFKIDGKPVFNTWFWDITSDYRTDELLAGAGIDRDSYIHITSTKYAIDATSYGGVLELVTQFNVGQIQQGYVYNGKPLYFWQNKAFYKQEAGYPSDPDGIRFMLGSGIYPRIDGISVFAVNQSLENLLLHNQRILSACKEFDKIAMTGISFVYQSASQEYHGWRGSADMWNQILALPPAGRPTMVMDTTGNDVNESTDMAPSLLPVAEGMMHMPLLSQSNIDNPAVQLEWRVSHDGINKFLRPWRQAYRNNQLQPVFTQDAIFISHLLHPVFGYGQTPLMPNRPQEWIDLYNSGHTKFTQQVWEQMCFATGVRIVGNTNQISDLNNIYNAGMTIHAAFHLLQDSTVSIELAGNTYTTTLTKGYGFFECPLAVGTPTVKIIRGGNIIKQGSSPQRIRETLWPGGGAFGAWQIA